MERCTGITSKGTQCTRICSNGKCFQHTNENPCSICTEPLRPDTSRTLPCNHTFHNRCIDRWKRVSLTCPMCRAPFDQPEYNLRIDITRLADNVHGVHEYVTRDVTGIIDNANIPPGYVNSPLFTGINLAAPIIFGSILNDVLRDLGIASFRAPGSDTVTTT